jgi:hypothetical protein
MELKSILFEKVNLVSVPNQSWNWNLGMIPKILKDKREVRARFPPTANDKILIIQFLIHPHPELGPSSD